MRQGEEESGAEVKGSGPGAKRGREKQRIRGEEKTKLRGEQGTAERRRRGEKNRGKEIKTK